MAEQTESRTTIGAPRERVMAVIADLEAYPSWNGEVREVQVRSRHADGRPSEVAFVLDAGAVKDRYVLAYEWSGDERVRWSLVQGEVLTAMDGSYDLVDHGDGTTEVVYRLAVDVRIPMIGMIKRKAEKVIVDRALTGLKKRAEA